MGTNFCSKSGLGDRLRAIRGEVTVAEFAAKLGVHKNTLARYERGDSSPDGALLAKIALDFKVSASWLLLGEGAPVEKSLGALEGEPRCEGLFRMVAQGDAMAPTLLAGDLAFCEPTGEFLADGLYAIEIGGAQSVRRIQLLPDGAMNILSDNPAYPPVRVESRPVSDFKILGKAKWIARRV